MTYQPDVSVIVVSNARPDALALTLKALEYQRYQNFETIVVSDLTEGQRPASPLGIHWIDYAERNISAARNLGLCAARGEVIAFIDDDAVPEFGWLTALIAPFETPQVGASGGFVRGRNGVSFQWKAAMFDRLGADHPFDVPDEITIVPPNPERFLKTVGTNCAFRRAALMEVGGFDTAYRFFLDEADLNLRLSEAGWHAAINPAAEVLHGFAEGPHRTARRVPTTLHEIGASAAYFLHRHAPPKLHAGRISAFRAEQWARVLRHHGMGLLSGTQVRYLMTSFDAGIAEGPTRQGRTIASENWSTEHFIPKPSRAPAGRIVLSAPLFGGAGTRRAAEVAARDGYEVTLLTPEVSARPLTVQFMPEGYFQHRFGLAGKSERQNPLRLQSVAHRIKNERLRIEPQRLLETPATFIS